MRQPIALAALLFLSPAIAFAQAPSTSPTQPATTPAPAGTPTPGPGGTVSTPGAVTAPTPPANAPSQASARTSPALASDIMDENVYDMGQNKIGEVEDLIIDPDGKVSSALVGVGGFLGMGEKQVQVPYADIKRISRDGKNWLELDRSKDQLQSAPAFDSKTLKR